MSLFGSIRFPISHQVKRNGHLDVTVWGSVTVDDDGQTVIDHDKDVILTEDLDEAAKQFALESGEVDADHDGVIRGRIVESITITPEKREALGLGDGKRQGWAATMRVTDPETIARVEAGELKEASIEYQATRQDLKARHPPSSKVGVLKNLKLFKLSLVPEGAGKGVDVVLFKSKKNRKPEKKGLDEMLVGLAPEVAAKLSALPEDIKAAVMSLLETVAAPKEEPPKPEEEPQPPKSRELGPEVKALLDAQIKAREALETQVKALERQSKVRGMLDACKAAGLETLPSGKALDKLAIELVDLEAVLGETGFKSHFDTLKRCAAAVKSSPVLKRFGDSGEEELSPFETLKRKGREIQARDKVPADVAFSKACKENPDLYAKSREG